MWVLCTPMFISFAFVYGSKTKSIMIFIAHRFKYRYDTIVVSRYER